MNETYYALVRTRKGKEVAASYDPRELKAYYLDGELRRTTYEIHGCFFLRWLEHDEVEKYLEL